MSIRLRPVSRPEVCRRRRRLMPRRTARWIAPLRWKLHARKRGVASLDVCRPLESNCGPVVPTERDRYEVAHPFRALIQCGTEKHRLPKTVEFG